MTARLEPPFARDAHGMAAHISGAPRQIEDALERGTREAWHPPLADPDLLAVGAMGGSAISADLSRALFADRLPRPVLAVRDYRWPACVGPRSLALLASSSGETEETLALYRDAASREVPRMAMTSGGTLAAWCARDGVACAALPHGMPPRAAVYASWVAFTRLLARLGWIDDPTAAWREAARRMEDAAASWGPDVPERDNPAKRLARALHGRFPLIYAPSERLGPVATRLRNQINENAKLLGHSAVLPELHHNEIVGWETPGAVRDRIALVLLEDVEDSPQNATRAALTAELAERHGVPVLRVGEREGGRLARIAALVYFGDYMSLYLALLNDVDPTPIATLDALKRRLAEYGASRGH